MKIQFIKFTVVCCLSLFATSIFAQSTPAENQSSTEERADRPDNDNRKPPRGERPTFAKILKDLDSNNDGKLSKKETKGSLKKDFAKIDKNKDGFINEAEFKNAPLPPRPPRRDQQ